MTRSGMHGGECAEHGEGQIVAGRHAPADGGRKARVDDGALGCRHLDGAKNPFVVGQVRQQRAFERIGRHGERVGQRAVDGAIDLGRSARVIDADLVALHRDGNL